VVASALSVAVAHGVTVPEGMGARHAAGSRIDENL